MQLVWKSKEEEKVEEVAPREGKIGNSLSILSTCCTHNVILCILALNCCLVNLW